MTDTRIEWATKVWNPTTGCTHASAGCLHCYAERQAKRFAGRNGYPTDNPFKVTLHPERLDMPLRWKKPQRIFVDSMSDLFHPDVPDRFIVEVFGIMWWAPQHTFQVLTKRPERMRDLMPTIEAALRRLEGDLESVDDPTPLTWPLPNVWLGTSVENQQAADERIPLLLQTPAAVRFISAEPLLGPIDIPYLARCAGCGEWLSGSQVEHGNPQDGPCGPRHAQIDWVIVGGESGPGARPMNPDWARSLRDQCRAAGVPFMFKQWGQFCYPSQMPDDTWQRLDANINLGSYPDEPMGVGKKAAGRLLDGVLHDEYPEVRHDAR